MSIQSAIDSYLRADTTLMSYLGGAVAPTLTTGRLYYMVAPEGASLPYVVYTKVSDTDSQEFFAKDTGQGRLQFDVVSTTKGSYVIEERLRALLRYASGSIGGLTTTIIYPVNRREKYNADTSRYVWSSDYIVSCQY